MLSALQDLRRHLLCCEFVKSCSPYVLKTNYCVATTVSNSKVVKRKTKTKKQKIHKNHEVVKYVMEHFQDNSARNSGILDISKNDLLYRLQTNTSQMLGFNIEEVSKRVDLFRAAGIGLNDSISLSFVIPSCFHINNNNFKNVLRIMQKYELPVESILYKYPHIGGFEHVQLERNLKLLNDLKLIDMLPSLITEYPLLLSYQLNKNSLSILEKSSFHLDEKRTAVQYLQLPLEQSAVENKIVKKLLLHMEKGMKLTKDAEKFFMNYDIDIEKVYQMCPDIFMSTKEALEKSLDCVLSSPFYFDVGDVEKLIMTYPDVFISFHHENVVAQVQYMDKVSDVKGRLYKLLSENPEIFRDSEKFFQRVALLKQYRFTDADIGRLLAQKRASNCFVDCDDYTDQAMEKLLKIYFGPRDLKPIQIIYSSPICLSTRALNVVTKRLKFVRHIKKIKEVSIKRKPKKNQLTLQRIIKSDSTKFATELCGQTLEEFEEFLKNTR